jgi:hypothetical protein
VGAIFTQIHVVSGMEHSEIEIVKVETRIAKHVKATGCRNEMEEGRGKSKNVNRETRIVKQ